MKSIVYKSIQMITQQKNMIKKNLEISRQSIPKLIPILQSLQDHRWELKESKNIPSELIPHFKNYSEYEVFQKFLEDEIEKNHNLCNQFTLDILPFIDFLLNYSRISSKSIPEIHLTNILENFKNSTRTTPVLLSALKLATTKSLNKESQSELIKFLEKIDDSSPFLQKTLLSYCLSELCRRSKRQKVYVNEATSILQTLGQLNLLRISSVTQSTFIQMMINKCRESINERRDWKNLALLCNVFAHGRDALLLECCKSLGQQFEDSPSFKDLVTVVWSLSQCQRKETPEFAYVIENLIVKQKLETSILKSQVLADKVVTFWSLHKIYSEAVGLQPLIINVEKALFENIRHQIHQDSHPTNISQFYVASLRLKLLDEETASLYFESVLSYGEKFMLALCIYETSLQYPNLLNAKRQIIQSRLENFVRPDNIANMFATFKNNDEIKKELLKLTEKFIDLIPFSGLEIIASVINSAEFNGKITRVLLEKFKLDSPQVKEIFAGNQQQVASLLLKMDLNKENDNVQSELLIKILDFYQKEYLSDPENSTPKGLGNILYLASKKAPSDYIQYVETLSKHSNWITQQYLQFDMLELLKLFKALNRFQCLTREIATKIDDRLEILLLQNKQIRAGKSGKFLSSFTQHYKKSYVQLKKVNKIINEANEELLDQV